MSARARERGPVAVDVDRGGGRGGVADIQRARMIAAMALVARERGVGATTVADVVARSGVSRRTFYELFEDRDACFRAAFDQSVERAARRVLPAYRAAGTWPGRMRAGLGALLEFLDDEPDLAALCVVDALGAGPAAFARRAEVVRLLIGAVDEGRREARVGAAKPTRLAAEGVVGAVLSVLHARLSEGKAVGSEPMTGLLGPLMAMVVLPYQGQAAAAREAAKPSPRRRSVTPRSSDPLQALDMRLTYRTVRVLLAIGTLAGEGAPPSNREVADAAGVADPGQISKLLARLEHLGLIRKDGGGPYRGEPNAWRLTDKGQQIERTIRQ
ncbi:MAG TPA: TetR family transcriptional regulator [Solirubrobacteraceae bacterium]|nr:TetR family transcriptional regulator [Solirubrobacteraceae bacterium]